MKRKFTNESKEISMKSGSRIQFHLLSNNGIWIKTTPPKKKHNTPKAGNIHITRETAVVVCGQLLLELNLPISLELENAILDRVNDLIIWPNKD